VGNAKVATGKLHKISIECQGKFEAIPGRAMDFLKSDILELITAKFE